MAIRILFADDNDQIWDWDLNAMYNRPAAPVCFPGRTVSAAFIAILLSSNERGELSF
jgi:hypothetical protein